MRFRRDKITAGDVTLCLYVGTLSLVVIDVSWGTGISIAKVIAFPLGWLIVPISQHWYDLSVETTYAIFAALQGGNCILWVVCIEWLLHCGRKSRERVDIGTTFEGNGNISGPAKSDSHC